MTTASAKVRRFRSRVAGVAAERGRAAGLATAACLSVGSARRAGAYLLETVVDLRMGATTRGMVWNESLLETSAGADGHVYQAVPVRKLRRILAAVPLRPADATFLDLGAGRGRALLLAAEAGFGDVVGVEFDPALAGDAERNLARRSGRRTARGRSASVLRQDAADVVLPGGPVVVFVYNSFGPRTLCRVLDRIEDSFRADPRPLMLAYHNPVHADLVEERPTFLRTAGGRDWALYAVGQPAIGHRPPGHI